ncbi:MAG: hypothetical protein JO033_23770 [Acidobacteriaceae bacterium]|nr:hypothetical protein [Acidobacteriaceae bacterium]MBV9502710.1 hypothetical protein [Acidobacteriaceae bacterium]
MGHGEPGPPIRRAIRDQARAPQLFFGPVGAHDDGHCEQAQLTAGLQVRVAVDDLAAAGDKYSNPEAVFLDRSAAGTLRSAIRPLRTSFSVYCLLLCHPYVVGGDP